MITNFIIITIATLLLYSGLLYYFKKKELKFKPHFFIGAILIAIPGALIPAYFLHIFDNFIWYYTFRTIPFINYTVILTAPLFALSARFLPRLELLFVFTMMCCIFFPFAKHILTPLDSASLNNIVEDGITMQSTGSTCGPSSLATLLRKKGIEISEKEIARACNTTQTGTEIWYIKNYLDKINIDSKFTYSKQEILYPAIAGIITNEKFGHFISIIDKVDGTYIIGDPMVGKIEITEKEIHQKINFTGFYLLLPPE